MSDGLWKSSALELKAMLEKNETSSEAIVSALLARIDGINPTINAVIHRFDDDALSRAKAADVARGRGESWGPLHGLPLTIKESMATEGLPVTLGIPNRKTHVQQRDAVVVQLLKEAGAIILGKTNVPQLLLCNETENKIWGRTLNPFNHTRSPGGSSGGEAAAIASGMSLWGIGTDIGGSVRVPAAYCGISGLKPTVDRWSNLRSFTALSGQEVIRGQCGPMARTAADVAYLFRAIDGPLHSPLDPAVPPIATRDPKTIPMKGMKIGYYANDGYLAAAKSLKRAVEEAVKHLAGRGAEVVPFIPPGQRELMNVYYGALSSDGGKVVKQLMGEDEPIDQLKRLMKTARLPSAVRKAAAWFMGHKGETRVQNLLTALGTKDVATYWQLTAARTRLRYQTLEAWDKSGLDLVICPTHTTPAIAHMQFSEFSMGGCYAMRYNLLNLPCGIASVSTVRPDETQRDAPRDRVETIAAEVEKGTAGLPLGVQVVGRPYQEDRILAAMMAIEEEAQNIEGFPHTPVP